MTALEAPVHDGRRLDWRPRFDERSRAFRAISGAARLPTVGRLWKHGRVLDQGSEGACVGMGCAGEVAAEPVPVPGADTFQFALRWYKHAQRLDDWPGDAYSGTSVLAGMLHGRAMGVWAGFVWAFTPEELAARVARPASRGGGPAVIGVEWRSGSYETDALGVLRPSGPVVGGHCVTVLGFAPDHISNVGPTLQQQLTDAGLWDGYLSVGGACFVILNSWGPSFGRGGLALVPLEVMRAWFAAGGEFAIPEGRKVPTVGAINPDARQTNYAETQPATAAPDRTRHLRAVELRNGDRIVAGLPAELDQETATVESARLVAGWAGDRVRVATTAGAFSFRASEAVTVRRPVT